MFTSDTGKLQINSFCSTEVSVTDLIQIWDYFAAELKITAHDKMYMRLLFGLLFCAT